MATNDAPTPEHLRTDSELSPPTKLLYESELWMTCPTGRY